MLFGKITEIMDVEHFKRSVRWSFIYTRRALLEGHKSIKPEILV